MRTKYLNLRFGRWVPALTLSIFLSLSAPLRAAPVDQQIVQRVTETWVRNITADAQPNATIVRMEAHVVDGDTTAYIVHLSSGGFCLSGSDDLLLPVYLYNPEYGYDATNPEYNYVLWEMSWRLDSLRTEVKSPSLPVSRRVELDQRRQYWQDLANGLITVPEHERGPGVVPYELELPLTARWTQYAPYNNLCPLGDGGQSVVGCVATAMAQLMHYWQWPGSGVGSSSYTWDGDQSCEGSTASQTLAATYSDSYNWSQMPDNCTGGCSSAEQAALAELSYEAGVSVEMDYGFCGSAAATSDVPDAIENRFRYDTDSQFESVGPATPARLVGEISWMRPVQMRGENADGEGHSWVVYGYRQTSPAYEYLCNMGWGGTSGHVWYILDNVPQPFDKGYAYQLAPAHNLSVGFVGASSAGDGSPDDPYENIEEAIAECPTGGILIFQAGSTNGFDASSLVITKNVILKGYGATIQ